MDSLEREARERKKQMIALCTLPLSVAFFVWRLQINPKAEGPNAAEASTSVKEKVGPKIQAAAGTVIALEKQRIVVLPVSSRDPFAPAFAAQKASAPAEKPASAPAGKPAISELPSGLPPLKPFAGFPPLKPVGGPPAIGAAVRPVPPVGITPAVPTPPAVPAPPVMPYSLTGIVKGDPDVAILRHTDGSRRLARLGDALDKTYRLTAIEESWVQVTGAGEVQTLRLGGGQPAAGS